MFLVLAPSPLTVSFKLPVSEISEIDDHKSVKENNQMISSFNLSALSDCDHQTELQTQVERVADVGQQERRLGQGGDQHQPGEYQGEARHY